MPHILTLDHTRVTLAWLVHLFTMSGALWACLAVVALFEGRISKMWLWLGIALIVDAIDGTLARKADVKTYAPGFDGATLDSIVDYLTWTFIPALFMFLYVPLGSRWMAATMFVLVCVSSLFCYCNVNLKTSDNFFMGFPAAWNVVAVIMWVLATGPQLNVLATVVFSFLTVAPLTFVHPFRVTRLMSLNVVATALWIGSTAVLVAQYPPFMPRDLQGVTPPAAEILAQSNSILWLAVSIAWWGGGLWLMLISALRTAQGLAARSAGRNAQ